MLEIYYVNETFPEMVGIGVQDPSATLDVSGDVKNSGVLDLVDTNFNGTTWAGPESTIYLDISLVSFKG